MKKKVVIAVSGTGSLLEAMIGMRLFPIELVLADCECRGLGIAKAAGIPTLLIPKRGRPYTVERDDFTREVCEELRRRGITIVVMAGYMTIFGRYMFSGQYSFGGRILNIHPSLLPAFKGEHAVRDALEYGVKVTGTTVHVATEELDTGPILAQEVVLVMDGDTEATLHERIKVVERKLYPTTIHAFLRGLDEAHA